VLLLEILMVFDAAATSCEDVQTFVRLPSPDPRPRPTNTVVRLSAGPDTDLMIVENGVERVDVVKELVDTGTTGEPIVTLSTLEPFTPASIVEVMEAETGEPVITFVVADEPDTTPPTWDGEFIVHNSRELQFHPCLPVPTIRRHHEFEWIGLIDETWSADELFVHAEPRVEGGVPLVGDGVGTSITFGGICGPDEDRSLKGEFHRVYDVFVEDGSGNRIGPFAVDTRDHASAGCAAVELWRGSPLVLAGAVVGLRRRRRRSPDPIASG
jgi:hypothetical protein